MKNRALLTRLVTIFVVVIAAALIAYRFYTQFTQAVQTQTVLQTTEYQTVDVQLYTVRKESLVAQQSAGESVPTVQDGERVAKGEPLAALFSSEEKAQAYLESRELEKKLHRYDVFQNSSAGSMDIHKLDREIDLSFLSWLDIVDSGDLEDYAQQSDLLLDKLTLRQAAVSGRLEDNGVVTQLRQELQQAKALGKPQSYINAEQAGYFVSDAAFCVPQELYQTVLKQTVSDIERLLSAEPQGNPGVMGKLVQAHEWYVLTLIPAERAAQFQPGGTAKLLMDQYESGFLEMEVRAIGAQDNGKVPLVLSSREMNAYLSGMKVENARLVLQEYKGLKVARAAVRVQDGVKGVYIRRNQMVNFRRLDVVYETADFVIAVHNTHSSSPIAHVKLYDEVITQGRDLYDRKIIN